MAIFRSKVPLTATIAVRNRLQTGLVVERASCEEDLATLKMSPPRARSIREVGNRTMRHDGLILARADATGCSCPSSRDGRPAVEPWVAPSGSRSSRSRTRSGHGTGPHRTSNGVAGSGATRPTAWRA
jgi:hypothetical protein